MAIFKRFEVWLLLFVIGGAVWFVMQPPPADDDPVEAVEAKVKAGGSESKPEKATGAKSGGKTESPGGKKTSPKDSEPEKVATDSERFEIQQAKIVSENGGSVVEISVLGNQDKKLDLAEPNARLVNGEGDHLERFFLPFDPPPVLEGADSVAELKYWVKGDLKADEKFWLEIDGDRLAVELEKR